MPWRSRDDHIYHVNPRRHALEQITAEVNAYGGGGKGGSGEGGKTVDEVAMGFIQVANEAMCRPIRALTQMKVGG